jgi:hypothetical protein
MKSEICREKERRREDKWRRMAKFLAVVRRQYML